MPSRSAAYFVMITSPCDHPGLPGANTLSITTPLTPPMTSALTQLPALDALRDAQRIVYARFAPTPQQRWPLLDAHINGRCWVKHENHTPVGAFKVRGGLVYMERLRAEHPGVPGIVSATRGNHGQSLAFAARQHGIPVAIVVPSGNSRDKNAAMRALGAEVLEVGDDFQAAVEAAAVIAAERGWLRVPSFDLSLVAGVGTWALELLESVPDLQRLYVPIGLGSGLCGALAAKQALAHPVELVGVVSSGAPAYALSLEAGHAVSHAVTTKLADGMACRTPDARALEILLDAGVRVLRVSDVQVAEAMRLIFSCTHNAAEGAGAAGLAALLQDPERAIGESVGFVLCGGNVDSDVFSSVLRDAAVGAQPQPEAM